MFTRSSDNRLALFICLQFYSFMAMGQNRFEDIFNIDNSGIGVYNFSAKIDSNLIIPDTIYIYDKTCPIQYIRSMGLIGIEELKTIQLPYNLLGIGNNAFEDCINLENIFIPEKVRFIKKDAFLNTGLRYASVADGNTQYDSRNNCNAIIETATCKLISGCNNTVIPPGVKIIGKLAFDGMSNLVNIVIPEGVTDMEELCFASCDNLEAIELPTTIKTVDDCFGGCDKLKSVTIYSRKPPVLYHHDYREYMDIKLYVPKGCRKKYLKTAWRDFGNIIEMENKGG